MANGLKAILAAGDFILSTEWAHKKYGSALDNLEIYINKFSDSYNFFFAMIIQSTIHFESGQSNTS